MKRLLVFLVLVGWAVPGWGDSTDIDTALVSEVVAEYWDKHLSRYKFTVPASLVVLGAPGSALFDSVYVFPPKRVSGGGMVLRLKGFYITPRYPSVSGWPEIYHIYADTIICKGRCEEITLEDIMRWLETPYHRQLFIENLGKEED